jgi:lysyl-tRNA synthetase class 2
VIGGVLLSDRWQPSASLDEIKRRADVLAEVRRYFSDRQVLEVETPLLSSYTVTDPFVTSIEVPYASPGEGLSTHYLQTSPEYAMKRLLAAYGSELSGIYQICKAFRGDDCSSRHNPEFTMLEWYRLGFSLQDLMDEVEGLLRSVYSQQGQSLRIHRRSYQSLFEEFFGINPHRAELVELRALATPWLPEDNSALAKKDLLELLFGFGIEPKLAGYQALFVSNYPKSMSALAQLREDKSQCLQTASRFELYLGGVEVANGYHELRDPQMHLSRFSADQRRRDALSLPAYQIDQRFMSAVSSGLPDSSGVALGLDRLLMAISGQAISGVISFPSGLA